MLFIYPSEAHFIVTSAPAWTHMFSTSQRSDFYSKQNGLVARKLSESHSQHFDMRVVSNVNNNNLQMHNVHSNLLFRISIKSIVHHSLNDN